MLHLQSAAIEAGRGKNRIHIKYVAKEDSSTGENQLSGARRRAFPKHHQDHSNNVASCGFMSDLSVQIQKQCAYMCTFAQGEKKRILLRGLKRNYIRKRTHSFSVNNHLCTRTQRQEHEYKN